MLVKYLSITVFLSLVISCTNNQNKPDRCECDPISNLGNQTDSARKSNNSGYDVNGKITVEVSAAIKKIINAGITIDANDKNYEEEVKTRVNTIVDKFPEITNLQKFEWDFYCLYIKIICQNKSLDDDAFLKLKMDKLNSIHDLIQKLLLEKIRGRSSQNLTSQKQRHISPSNTSHYVDHTQLPPSSVAIKTFELILILNVDDNVIINGKPAEFINGDTENIKKVKITEGGHYEVKIGNCDPIIIPNVTKNERITRCS